MNEDGIRREGEAWGNAAAAAALSIIEEEESRADLEALREAARSLLIETVRSLRLELGDKAARLFEVSAAAVIDRALSAAAAGRARGALH